MNNERYERKGTVCDVYGSCCVRPTLSKSSIRWMLFVEWKYSEQSFEDTGRWDKVGGNVKSRSEMRQDVV